ncbi:MAG: sugar phosphate isomerase/epimerase [Candidatus Thorarchaeota archaeon]
MSDNDAAFLDQQISALTRVKEAGIEYVEIFYNRRAEWVGNRIKDTLKEEGLTPYSIHMPKFILTYSKDDFEETTDTIFQFIEGMGVAVVVMHPPEVEMLIDEEWRRRLEIILDRSEDAGCMLTLEIVPYLRCVEMFIDEQITQHYEDRALGVTVDLEHMHIQELKMEWLINDFGKRIVNIHFRDSNGSLTNEAGKRNYIFPGEGEIDLCGILRTLHQWGYDKAITIEIPHRSTQDIIQSKAVIEDCLRRVSC